MTALAHILKSLLIPLVLALVLYVILFVLILPFIRRHRTRYTNYYLALPLSLPAPPPPPTHSSSFSSSHHANGTTSDGNADRSDDSSIINTGNGNGTTWRTTVSDALYVLFMPSRWRGRRGFVAHLDEGDVLFDDDEGEDMVGFEPVDEERRRGMLERGARGEQRRVSRELEVVFRDESESESEDERRRSLARSRR